MKGNILE